MRAQAYVICTQGPDRDAFIELDRAAFIEIAYLSRGRRATENNACPEIDFHRSSR